MLSQVSWKNHFVVAAVVAGSSAAGVLGFVGEPWAAERYDSRLVFVAPADPGDPTSDALRIVEVSDQDFGDNERRGHERYIPVDLGIPTDVTARSTTAPDQVQVDLVGNDARIRIGDPDVTVRGQHRYELGFTLPAARVSTGELALDIIGTEEELETGRFEVVLAGFGLDDPSCNVGAVGTVGGCTLARDGDVYRVVIRPLRPGEGITIGGTIVGRTEVTPIPEPPLPPLRTTPDHRVPLGAAMMLLGIAAAAGVFRLNQRLGRNEIFAGGAADAAFGSLPTPGPGGEAPAGLSPLDGRPTVQVTDRRLGQLSTIEFSPPAGVEPWQGSVLLEERIDDSVVSAWFSGLAGNDFVGIEQDGDALVVTPGRRWDRMDAETARMVAKMFDGREQLRLDGYDEAFAAAWSEVHTMQNDAIRHSGWWKNMSPHNRDGAIGAMWVNVALIGSLVVVAGLIVLALVGAIPNVPLALIFAALLAGCSAFVVYRRLLPARSATGSALTLRTASFKRFLEASEGQHVEWAWERGVIREYTAWAVALGSADAWSRALEASNVVPRDPSITSPLLVYTMASTLNRSHVAPSSSDSGSSSSFSGGSVGSGGGGGRSGSW